MNHVEVMKQALAELDRGLQFGSVHRASRILSDAIASAGSQQGLPEPKQYPKMPNVISPAAQPERKPVLWSVTHEGQHCGNVFLTLNDAFEFLDRMNTEYPNEIRKVVPLYE